MMKLIVDFSFVVLLFDFVPIIGVQTAITELEIFTDPESDARRIQIRKAYR